MKGDEHLMKATKKQEITIKDTKMQKKDQTSGPGTLSHKPIVTPGITPSVRGSRDTTNHISGVQHESHKYEYRRDHAKIQTGVKIPVAAITGKPEPFTKTPAASVIQ
jgi:hypothetical protein